MDTLIAVGGVVGVFGLICWGMYFWLKKTVENYRKQDQLMTDGLSDDTATAVREPVSDTSPVAGEVKQATL